MPRTYLTDRLFLPEMNLRKTVAFLCIGLMAKEFTEFELKHFMETMDLVMDQRSKEYLHKMFVALKATALENMLTVRIPHNTVVKQNSFQRAENLNLHSLKNPNQVDQGVLDFSRRVQIHEREKENHSTLYSNLINTFDNLYEE